MAFNIKTDLIKQMEEYLTAVRRMIRVIYSYQICTVLKKKGDYIWKKNPSKVHLFKNWDDTNIKEIEHNKIKYKILHP